jgi:hypothetical protein
MIFKAPPQVQGRLNLNRIKFFQRGALEPFQDTFSSIFLLDVCVDVHIGYISFFLFYYILGLERAGYKKWVAFLIVLKCSLLMETFVAFFLN